MAEPAHELEERVALPASASISGLARYNADLYGRIWRYAHFFPPESTPWWPLLENLAASAPRRLEIGPGPWPRLPVAGTHVVDLSAAALALLEPRGAIVHRGLVEEVGF